MARVLLARHAAVFCGLAVFSVAFMIRLINCRQPLLENFIDRQVHTAMMARNLARGGSMLAPQIDIGPFPAYYMLEFPGYPAVVAYLSRLTSLPLDLCGRLVSCLAMAFACTLLFDLSRRHFGLPTGLLAGVVLASMPVAVRFGRAFQPDATMLSLLVLAIWAMDRWAERGRARDLALAGMATAGALLLKVIAAYFLLVLGYLAYVRVGRRMWRRRDLWLVFAATVLPVMAWYIYAWSLATSTHTVSTPFWQLHKWVALGRFVELGTYRQLAYYLGLRVITPIGVVLSAVGIVLRVPDLLTGTPPDAVNPGRSGPSFVSRAMLFHIWLASLVTYLPVLIRKLDHEHYYLAFAPVVAVFIARALCAMTRWPLAKHCYVSGQWAAIVLLLLLLATDVLACRSTFEVPSEWNHVPSAAAATRELTPPNALVAGHSSVLFHANRRGFTFAYGRGEIEFLFMTWNIHRSQPTAWELLEFYRTQGAEYFVELLGTNRERENPEFFRSLREHYPLVFESPNEFLIVSLDKK